MEDIIAPIDRELLKSELTAERRLRSTNKSHNEIYIVNWKNAPNVLKEIGRLREIAFRAAGGGTGQEGIVIYWAMRWNLTNMASLSWQQHICSISRKSS